MNLRRAFGALLGSVALGLSLLTIGAPAHAQLPTNIVIVDCNGNGSYITDFLGPGETETPLLSSFTNDPGPGGLNNVLTYALPFAGTQGDVAILNPDFGFDLTEIIRFNGDGTLIFYSNPAYGGPSLADTPTAPGDGYDNFEYAFEEYAPEFGAYATFWWPFEDEPGGDVSDTAFVFISDISAVPEPSQVAGFGMGLFGLGFLAFRARRRKMTAA
jgi:hypothetical protein